MDHLLRLASKLDPSYDRILCSMCTRPHKLAVKAHMKFIDRNLGDPDLFPGTKMLENQVIAFLGKLLGLETAHGYISSGGTESNIQALRAFRNLAKSRSGNFIVSKAAHFSLDKAADVLGIEIRKASLDEDYRVDLGSVEDLIDQRTFGLVGIAGTSELGQVDDIQGLAKLGLDHGIPLHVDAAFGGLVLPFLNPEIKFDFRVRGVESITVDPHKMGLCTLPAGGLLFRDWKYMDQLKIPSPYLISEYQYTLVGTRPGASVAACYAVFSKLGYPGLKKVVDRCMQLTRYLAEEVQSMGFDLVIQPVMNILAFKLPNPHQTISKLFKMGWKVTLTSEAALRIVVMPHLNFKILNRFLKDLRKCI